MSECGHGAVGEEGKGATSLRHRRKERDVLGAFKYDVHIVLGIFDPLPLFVRKIYTALLSANFLHFLTSLPPSLWTSYMESPLLQHVTTTTKRICQAWTISFAKRRSRHTMNVLFGSFLSNLEIMCDEYVKLFRRVFA